MALTHPLMLVVHTHITFFTLYSHLLPYPPILLYLCRTLCSIFYLLYNTPSSTWSLTNYLTSVVKMIEAYISPNWKKTPSYKKKCSTCLLGYGLLHSLWWLLHPCTCKFHHVMFLNSIIIFHCLNLSHFYYSLIS